MKIKEIIKAYKENDNYLCNLNVSKKNKVLSVVFGYLTSLIIMASPIVIVSHFFIYSFYRYILILILMIFINIFLILGEMFHHKLLVYFSNEKEKKSLIVTHIIDGFLYLLVTIISFIVLMLLFL